MTWTLAILMTAQVMLAHRSGVPASSTATPSPQWWFHAGDIAANGYVTNWVDRIAGVALTNSVANAPLPVKTNNYVTFDGTIVALQSSSTQWSWGSSGYTFAFIMAPNTARSQTLLPQTLWTDGGSSRAQYINQAHTNCVEFFVVSVDNTTVTNYYTTGGLTNDFVLKWISTSSPNSTYVSYLNGSLNYTNTGVRDATTVYEFGGRTSVGVTSPLYANVYDLLIYTNFPAGEETVIHNYGHATYGY